MPEAAVPAKYQVETDRRLPGAEVYKMHECKQRKRFISLSYNPTWNIETALVETNASVKGIHWNQQNNSYNCPAYPRMCITAKVLRHTVGRENTGQSCASSSDHLSLIVNLTQGSDSPKKTDCDFKWAQMAVKV
mmetsp:Transcript_19303/g.30823  ORF Transcript_19303/g.30823 Transcript_19303/m.30823 type:complete len:134 (+) Transcript_19303:803-1204(+)